MQALGQPIPASPHAVSVSLPTWADVVGYEEGDPRVLARLTAGYPRFVFNRYVAAARHAASAAHGAPGEDSLVFPSARVAEDCAAFLRAGAAAARVRPWRGLHATVFAAAALPRAKAFWQHAGAVVSSRRAEAALGGRPDAPGGAAARETLRRRVAAVVGADPAEVFLFPSGMAAIAAAHAAAVGRRPGRRTVQVGFPYVDTLKLQEKLGPGVLGFLAAGDEARLAAALRAEPVAALFTEVPANPLLQSPDLDALRDLARAHDAVLVVDDSINTFTAHDLTAHADLLVASLTKYFAGSGDVMAGVLVCSPRSPLRAELAARVRAGFEDLLFGADAVRLEEVSRDFAARVRRASATAAALCEALRGHPRVERVYYPTLEQPERYRRCLRPGGGAGGVFSLLVQDAPAVYDRLEVAKGPSFGMNVTLACPYTLLAHYQELDWAAACGIPRDLIRVSVGLEDAAELTRAFARALG
ncbi:MAG TPA: PLP-dependent transferase [Polyangia bacterium]